MFKHSKLLVLTALTLVTLAGCGGNDAPASTTSDSTSAGSTTSEVPPVVTYGFTVTNDNVVLSGLPEAAEAGEAISFTVAVKPGYEFSGQVTATSGNEAINVTKNGETFSFTMPAGDVEINPETNVSSFEIETIVPKDAEGTEHLTLTAYESVLETDQAIEALVDYAGTYNGTLYYFASSSTMSRRVTLYFDAYGNWNVKVYDGSDSIVYDLSNTFGQEIKVEEGQLKIAQGSTLDLAFNIVPADENGDISLVPTRALLGSYDYKDSGSLVRTEVAKAPEEGVYMPVPLDEVPDVWEYQGFYYIGVKGDNYEVLETISLNGVELSAETSGAFLGLYKIDIPYFKSTVTLTSETRYADITILAPTGFEAKAYAQVTTPAEEGSTEPATVTYEEITRASYEQEVFFKVTPEEGYSINWVSLQYDGERFGSSATSNLSLNEDGYWYAASGINEMSDMEYGMTFRVFGGTTLQETRAGWYINPGSSYTSAISGFGGDAETPRGSNLIRISSSTWASYDFVEEGATSGALTVHTGNSLNTYSGWYDGENLFVLDINDSGYTGSYIVFDGETRPTASARYNASALADADTVLQTITWTTGEGEEAVNHTKNILIETIDRRIVNADFAPTFSYKVGEDITTIGNVVEILRENGTSAGIFKITGERTMERTFALPAGEYTQANAEGDSVKIVVDETGFGITIVGQNAETTIEAPVVLSAIEENTDGFAASFVAANDTDVEMFTVTLNTADKTFDTVAGKPFGTSLLGEFMGVQLSYNASTGPSGSSYYRMKIANGVDTPTTGTWESGTSQALSITADGGIEVGQHVVTLSLNGQTAYTVDGSYHRILSKSITNYSSGLANLVTAKYGEGYIAEVVPSNDTHGTRNYDVFYLDPLYNFRWVDTNASETVDWTVNGARFTIIENGEVLNVFNDNGTIKNDISGEYTTADGATISFDAGIVTYGGISVAFNIVDENTVSFNVENEDGSITRYTVVLDHEARTAEVSYDVVQLQSVTPTVNLGTSRPWTYDEATGNYTSASGFSSASSIIEFTCDYDDWTLSFDWETSSESGYDYMWIRVSEGSQNPYYEGWSDSEKRAHSGYNTGSLTITGLAADTVVQIGYYKDGSSSSGSDNVVLSNVVAQAYLPVNAAE